MLHRSITPSSLRNTFLTVYQALAVRIDDVIAFLWPCPSYTRRLYFTIITCCESMAMKGVYIQNKIQGMG
jgi:hypothetical protein